MGAQPDLSPREQLVHRRLRPTQREQRRPDRSGGAATAAAVAAGMLRRAGADVGRAAAALTASTLMQIATRLTLPLFAIPAIIGGAPVSHSLVTSAYLGLLVLLLLDVAGILAFASDPPLLLTGRGLQWALNRTIRRRRKVTALPQRAPRRARLCPSHDRRAFEDSPADGCHERNRIRDHHDWRRVLSPDRRDRQRAVRPGRSRLDPVRTRDVRKTGRRRARIARVDRGVRARNRRQPARGRDRRKASTRARRRSGETANVSYVTRAEGDVTSPAQGHDRRLGCDQARPPEAASAS